MTHMRLWLVTSLLLATAAFAAPKKPTVILSGPPALTKFVSKELAKKYTPRPITTPVSAMPTAKEVRDVTGPSGAVALILCQASGQFLTLQVLNGADGTPLDTVTLKGTLKKLPKKWAKPELASLLFAVANGKAPGKDVEPVATRPEPKEEPAPVKETPVEPKKELAKKEAPPPPVEKKKEPEPVKEVVVSSASESEPSKPSSQPALRASVGLGGFNRTFGWAGNPSPTLATANQPFSGNVSVDVSTYPGAAFTSNFLANVGAFMTADFGVRMVSVIEGEGSRFAHSASRLRFGGLVRLPIGERFTVHAHLGYSRQEFTTSRNAVNDGSARPNIPDVLFNGFRAGLGVRLRIVGTLELDASGAFQTVAGKGELGSTRYFPKATALAVDAGGGLSIGLVEHLRLRAGVEWQRYFITLNPDDTSTFFARTAADQYITATASLQWVM